MKVNFPGMSLIIVRNLHFTIVFSQQILFFAIEFLKLFFAHNDHVLFPPSLCSMFWGHQTEYMSSYWMIMVLLVLPEKGARKWGY